MMMEKDEETRLLRNRKSQNPRLEQKLDILIVMPRSCQKKEL